MPEEGQVLIYTSDELSLIKNTFAENDTLLYTIRKVLLQFPLTETEKGLIRVGVTEGVYNVLETRFIPKMSSRFPITQIPDFLTTLTGDLNAKDSEMMNEIFEAKLLEQKYLEQQFALLKDIDSKEGDIVLADLRKLEGKDAKQRFIDMKAYLYLLGYIDPSLVLIKNLAGTKEETVEEQKKRLTRDSAK